MAIEFLTEIEEEFFDFIEQPLQFRHVPFHDYYSKLRIIFDLNPDVVFIQRSVYNSFMLLGDVGGFSGLLFSAGAAIVHFFTYNNAENYLANKLFQAKKDDQKNNQDSSQEGILSHDSDLDP